MRIIIVLLCLCTTLHAADAPTYLPHSEVDGDPSNIVAGCVNIITGAFSDSETDLIIPGPEPLIFQRFYCSTDWDTGVFCNSWTHNHGAKRAYLDRQDKQYAFYVAESTGSCLSYIGTKTRKAKDGRREWHLVPDNHSSSIGIWGNVDGLTNTGKGEIGGRTNLLNQKATFNHSTKCIDYTLRDGVSRIFQPVKPFHPNQVLPVEFILNQEIFNTGNQFHYSFIDGENEKLLRLIRATDSTGQCEFGSLRFDYSGDSVDHVLRRSIQASDDRKVDYRFQAQDFKISIHGQSGNYQITKRRWYLTDVQRPNAPSVHYEYHTEQGWKSALLSCKRGVDGRYLNIGYYRLGENRFGPSLVNLYDSRYVGRVNRLESPAGIDEQPVITHRFFYTDKYSDAHDAYNHVTRYFYNSGKRLTCIERYKGTGPFEKYSLELFYWNGINLACKALAEPDGKVRSCRYLQYDERNNVVQERLYGNLSGASNPLPVLDSMGKPVENGCECYAVYRTYSQDQFHRPLTETLPNGRVTEFRYQPNTQLIIAKLVKDQQAILTREFNEYDAYGSLVKTIRDNGCGDSPDDLTGISYRQMTRITPRAQLPGIGLPEVVEESYLDPTTGTERLLGKHVNSYTLEGWLTRQERYDANNELQYTLVWQHDTMGNIVLEQDALGQLIERQYDANGNKIKEQGPNHSFYTTYTYDYSNRLVAEEVISADGPRYKRSYRYDYLGNRVASTDFRGNETTYTYDDFGRLATTTLPSCIDAKGNLNQLTTTQQYDIAGNIIQAVDVEGHITKTTYNIRGKPVCVEHPDGTQEHYVYNLDGTLKSQTAANGTKTCFEYDVLGNVVSKKVFSATNELLTTTQATYRGTLLTSETDPNGYTTHYEYDGAGRQTLIKKAHTWTRIDYDSLGRKHKTIEWIGPAEDQLRITVTLYDLLNRVVEERIEGASGQLLTRTLTHYDASGNICGTTTFKETGPAMSELFYDTLQRPCRLIDAEGNQTHIHYDDRYQNETGQLVLRTTVVDALGSQTITTHDALERAVSCVKKDCVGNEIARSTHCYDGRGKLIRRTDIVKIPENPDRPVTTEWQYDQIGRVVAVHEGVNTPQARTTHLSYNAFGEREADLYVDGLIIRYQYDPMGRLLHHSASDETIDYRFKYDANSNVCSVEDAVHHTTTMRTYDSANRMVTEKLANDLTVTYQYDGLGRTTKIELPDHSGVQYVHDSAFLRAVSRLDPNGSTLYTHQYLQYDLSGQVMAARRIQKAGELTYTRDKLNRITSLKSPYFTEDMTTGGYDAVGNLLHKQRTDPIGTITCAYTYDPLYQLLSETGSSKHDYRYDSLNNRLAKDSSTCDIDALNQLTRQGDATYTYDLRGNRVGQSDGSRYTYDAFGRLIAFKKGDQHYHYLYDAFNRRVRKTCLNQANQVLGQENYLFQDQMEVGMVDASGKLVQFRTLGQGLGAEIGAAVAIELGDILFAPVHDHSGHVVALLNAEDGQPAELYHYTAFGETTTYIPGILYGWRQTATSRNPWRFASKRVDTESGLIHFGRRHFDPTTARWLTPDPSGYEDGPNLYAYVRNNPLAHIDLYGLNATSPTLKRSTESNRDESRSSTSRPKRETAELDRFGNTKRRKSGLRLYHLPWFERLQSWAGRSRNVSLDRPEPEQGAITCIVGQCCDEAASEDVSTHVSDLGGGVNVHATTNPTHRIIIDLIESVLGLFCFTTDPVCRLRENWCERLATSETILHLCWSQGAIHTRNALLTLPPEIRNRIFVIAIAPGGYIDPNTCADVKHYVSRDFVPSFDRAGMKRAEGTIIHVDPHPEAPYFDHHMMSKTYEPYIRVHIGNYRISGGNSL